MRFNFLIASIFLMPNFVQSQSVAVAADKMNTLYLGIDNPLSLAVSDINNNDIKVSIDNGTIVKTGNGNYIARPENEGICHIIVEYSSQKISREFRVKAIPDPYIIIGSKKLEGHLTPFNRTIQNFEGLVAFLQKFDFDAKCRVVSYTCTCRFASGEVKIIHVQGHTNNEVVECVRKLKVGDRFQFDNIYTICPGDKKPRRMEQVIIEEIK